MFQFLDRLAGKRKAQQLSARDEYHKLVRKGAVGKLTDTEVDRIADLAGQLGITETDMAQDAQAVADHAKFAPIAADLDKITAEREAATIAMQQFDIESNRIMTERNTTGAKLIATFDTARARVNSAVQARGMVEEIESEHWALFGKPDPAIRAGKRCLINAYQDAPFPPDGLPADAVSFQAVISSPEQFIADLDGHPHFGLDDVELVPATGQTRSELDHLYEVAKAAVANAIDQILPAGQIIPRVFAAYVVENPDDGSLRRLARHGRLLVYAFSEVMRDIAESPRPGFDPHAFTWLVHPGQRPRDMEKMRDAMLKAFDSHPHTIAQAKRSPENNPDDVRSQMESAIA